MDWYSYIVANKEFIKILYGLIISIICLIIVAKSHRLYKLSSYEGIRYFRNAFLFFSIAFIFRYIFGGFAYYNIIYPEYFDLIRIIFEFFLIIAGFFLLYSLLWKRIEGSKGSFSSLLNLRISIFYLMAFIITLLDYVWGIYYLLFFSQIIVFIIAAAISYSNYVRNGRKRSFLKFYFLAMILALATWVLNAVTSAYFSGNIIAMISIYLLNIVIFLLFLFGIIRMTIKPRSA